MRDQGAVPQMNNSTGRPSFVALYRANDSQAVERSDVMATTASHNTGKV